MACFAAASTRRALRRQLPRELERLLDQLLRGEDCVDEADAKRLIGVHEAAGHDQLFRPADADDAGQALRSSQPGMIPMETSGWPSFAAVDA